MSFYFKDARRQTTHFFGILKFVLLSQLFGLQDLTIYFSQTAVGEERELIWFLAETMTRQDVVKSVLKKEN